MSVAYFFSRACSRSRKSFFVAEARKLGLDYFFMSRLMTNVCWASSRASISDPSCIEFKSKSNQGIGRGVKTFPETKIGFFNGIAFHPDSPGEVPTFWGLDFFPADRFEPVTAEWEVLTPPLCRIYLLCWWYSPDVLTRAPPSSAASTSGS